MDATSGISVRHQHCSVVQASEHVGHSLHLTEAPQAADVAVESLVFVAD